MITNGEANGGKSSKKKPAKKTAGKSASAKKNSVKKTSKTKPTNKQYEEDFGQSAEFDTDENGESIDHPENEKNGSLPSKNGVQIGNSFYPNESLTLPEKESIFAHMVQCDEVYEAALSELERIAYKKQTEFDYLSKDLDLQPELQVVLLACCDLREEGVKPSMPDFAARLCERAATLAEQSEDFFGDEVPNCIEKLQKSQDLGPKHGLNLLQKQLQIQAKRVFDLASRHDIGTASESLQRRLQEIKSLTLDHALAADRIGTVLTVIEQYRGKKLHGLKTGLDNLDERTRGLRGLMMFCAPPGQGKTVFAQEIILGVLRQDEDNDCAVLLLSLEMTEEEMTARILSRLSGLHESVVYMGDDPTEGDSLDPESRKKLNKAIKEYKKLGKRLMLLDATQLDGQPPTERRILSLVDALKKRTKASQVLVVVDYLQLMDVGGQDGLQADRHQFQQLQNVRHAGHTVLAISESRKPANSKDAWTTSLADIKGDGRLGYGASGIFLMRPMSSKEIASCYNKSSTWADKSNDVTKFLVKLDKEGKTPICLFIDKMRAPGRRGTLFFEFDYLRNRMKPMEPGNFSDQPVDFPEDEEPASNPGAEV